MGRKVELEVLLNAEEARRGAQDLGRNLADAGRSGQKSFKAAGETLLDMAKTGVWAAMAQQSAAAFSAITGPALTTYGQAVEAAGAWRKETTLAALAAGVSFDEVKSRVDRAAAATKTLPEDVIKYAMSVKQATGSWSAAFDDIADFKNLSLELGNSLQENAALKTTLFNAYGKGGGAEFLSAERAQVKALGVDYTKLHQLASGTIGHVAATSSMSPAQAVAMSANILKGAGGNAELAAQRQQALMNYVEGDHKQFVLQNMVHDGVIKNVRDELDEQGKLKDPNKVITYLHNRQQKHIKKEGFATAMRIDEQGQNMGVQGAQALLHWDPSAVEPIDLKPPGNPTLARLNNSKYGVRAGAEIDKNKHDREAGESLLGPQDKAVELGGGWTGIAGTALQALGAGAGLGGLWKLLNGGKAAASTGAAAGTVASVAGKGALTTVAETSAASAELMALKAEAHAVGEIAFTKGGKLLPSGNAASRAELAGLEMFGKTGASYAAKGILGKAFHFLPVVGQVVDTLMFQAQGIDSLGKNSDFAKGVRDNQTTAAAHELAGQAQRAGYITPEIYKRAGGNEEVIQKLLAELSQRNDLAPDLADEVRRGMEAARITVTLATSADAPDGPRAPS